MDEKPSDKKKKDGASVHSMQKIVANSSLAKTPRDREKRDQRRITKFLLGCLTVKGCFRFSFTEAAFNNKVLSDNRVNASFLT